MLHSADLTGLLLAGGRGTRLDARKFLLPVGGRRLVDRALGALQSVCPRVLLSCNDPADLADLDLPVVPDAEPGHGPLGGIVAGLRAAGPGGVLAVAADMPLLRPGLLRLLVARAPEADVIIPRHNGHFEALCCVYGARCLEPAQELLRRGRNKIIEFFDQVAVLEINDAELEPFGPTEVLFFNVNTPADLARAEELARGRGL